VVLGIIKWISRPQRIKYRCFRTKYGTNNGSHLDFKDGHHRYQNEAHTIEFLIPNNMGIDTKCMLLCDLLVIKYDCLSFWAPKLAKSEIPRTHLVIHTFRHKCNLWAIN